MVTFQDYELASSVHLWIQGQGLEGEPKDGEVYSYSLAQMMILTAFSALL